jgi:PAS domain S-box-containing protein
MKTFCSFLFGIISMLMMSGLVSPVQAGQTVRIGYEQNHPIAGTASDGKAQGIMIDLIQEIARREGWTIKYMPCVWNKCLENLENAEIDLLVGIAYTQERAQKYSYNQHTIISNWGLLYSRPGQKIENYADLEGKRIALVKNDVYSNTFIKMLQQFNIRCQLVYAENFKEIFDMIEAGEVDAGVANRFFALLNERSFKVKATSIIFSPVSVQVAAPKDKNKDVLSAFDRHLEAMKKDRNSAYHQSLKRWLGIEGAGYTMPRWLWMALSGVLGGTALLGVFVALLRREVRRKTSDLLHEVIERRRSEEQLRLVLDNMQEIFVRTGLDGTILFISNGIELFGYKTESLKDKSFEYLCKVGQDFQNMLADLKAKETLTGYRITLLKQDGTERLVSMNARLLWDEDGTPASIIASGTDVTEQVRMGDLMAQTEKMMMVGGLAAGMAHEINNPLGILMQNIQNIERRVSLDLPANLEHARALGVDLQQVRDYLEQRGILKFMHQMRDAGDRMSRIITNMLKFSRKSESRIESASMEMVLEQALELAASDYDLKKHYDFKRIEILRDYGADLPKVPLTILEIEQVLLNLMKNAAQAMAFSQEKKQQHRMTLRTRQSGDWAIMEIEDNGPGMSKEVQRRIFDPFFTTKEVGIGTGLGLSVSYAIITNNHHGRLEVRSQPGEGTCFTIMLPLHYIPITRTPEDTP